MSFSVSPRHSARREIGYAHVGGKDAATRLQLQARRSRRRGAPATAYCGPSGGGPLELQPAVILRDRLHGLGLLLDAGLGAVGTRRTPSGSRPGRSLLWLLSARTASASMKSARPPASPICTAAITVFATHRPCWGSGRRRREIARAADRVLTVTSVITPSVPSGTDEQARQVVAGRRLLGAPSGLDDGRRPAPP